MPINFYKNIIEVDQLRSEIGDPTVDPTEIGGISDEELQGVIDRHVTGLQSRYEQRIFAIDPSKIPLHAYEEVRLDTIVSGGFDLLAYAEIDNEVFHLFPRTCVDEFGRELTYDESINFTVNRSLATKRRFMFSGNRIYVCPLTIEAITVLLPNKEKLYEALIADEVIKVNDMIINDARNMLKSKVIEGGRLQQGDMRQ
jgi:hypothetical protein